MRTIKDLLELEGRVYVSSNSEEVRDLFLLNVQKEGFTFGDGALPTSRPLDWVYALNKDMTINFIGRFGYWGFKKPELFLDIKLIRVDYEKYVNGEKDYRECKVNRVS